MVANGMYMNLSKEMRHNIPWDDEIQNDHPTPDRRQNLVLINNNKTTSHQINFDFSVHCRMKIKKKQNDRENMWILPESQNHCKKWRWQWY